MPHITADSCISNYDVFGNYQNLRRINFRIDMKDDLETDFPCEILFYVFIFSR